MSRAWIAVGSGLGAAGGMTLGSYLGSRYHGRMNRDEAMLTGEIVGAISGAILGTFIALPSPNPTQPVVVSGAVHGLGDWHPIGVFS